MRSTLLELVGTCFVGFLLLTSAGVGSAQPPAGTARISVEGASAAWSASLSFPAALQSLAGDLAPRRILIEYAAASCQYTLQHPWAPVPVPPASPPSQAGTLRIALGGELFQIVVNAPQSVLLLVDASGSMEERVDGESKMEIARAVLLELVAAMPAALRVGLLVFNDCATIEIPVPVGPLDRGRLEGAIRAFRPVANTPIAGAIARVPLAMEGHPEPYLAILLTDGMETCGGDPVHAARDLMARGYDLRMHVIGYDVAQYADAQRQLRQIAAEAGGAYFSADTTEELSRALVLLTPVGYLVYGDGAAVVADGVVGDAPHELPVGTYRVAVKTIEGDLAVEVQVRAGAVTTVLLDHVRGEFKLRAD